MALLRLSVDCGFLWSIEVWMQQWMLALHGHLQRHHGGRKGRGFLPFQIWSLKLHFTQSQMTLLGAPWRILTSALYLPATSPMFFFRFYFSSMRIPLTFFLTCCCRALVIVIHLYLCLSLPALIWSLPRFQVHVIMFSAPGWLCRVFPGPLVSSAGGEERSRWVLSLEPQWKD